MGLDGVAHGQKVLVVGHGEATLGGVRAVFRIRVVTTSLSLDLRRAGYPPPPLPCPTKMRNQVAASYPCVPGGRSVELRGEKRPAAAVGRKAGRNSRQEVHEAGGVQILRRLPHSPCQHVVDLHKRHVG